MTWPAPRRDRQDRGKGDLSCTANSVTGEASATVDVIWDNGDQSVARWDIVSYGLAPMVEVIKAE